MSRKIQAQGPYEFERPVRSSKFAAVASGVAGFTLAAAMLGGTAYAVTAASHPNKAESTVSNDASTQDAPAVDQTTSSSTETTDANANAAAAFSGHDAKHADRTQTSAQTDPAPVSAPVDVIKPLFGGAGHGDDGDDAGDDNDSNETSDSQESDD